MSKHNTLCIMLVALTTSLSFNLSHAQTARESPNVAAGYAPYPLAVAISDQVKQAVQLKKAPDIQSTSPESAYKQFCAGSGVDTIDATVVLRPMNSAEQEFCESNGVKNFSQFVLGYNAIVLSYSGNTKDFDNLTRKDLFLAMAKDIPDPQGGGKMIPNPYKTWKEINAALPDTKIQIWNSNPVFAYYPVVVNQIMLVGCRQIPALKSLEATDPKEFGTICTTYRKDGFYNEYDSLETVAPKIGNGIGIFTEAFATKFHFNMLAIDGVAPLKGSISHGLYPLFSPLVLQIKKDHLATVPGLKEYMVEGTSEKAINTSGYLTTQYGLIPLPLLDRRKLQEEVKSLLR